MFAKRPIDGPRDKVPAASLYESPFHGLAGWIKQADDMVLSGLILLVISPLMPFIALGVKLSSPGPISK